MTADKLVSQLEATKDLDLKGIKLSFSAEDHQGLQTPELFELTAGKSKLLKP